MSLLSPPLEAFWAVVQKGTVQNASYVLGITQTGVTQRIRSLEKQLKTTLFTRSRTGMKLTAEGLALLQYVKGSFEIEGMALSRIQRAAKDSITDVSISGPTSILRSRVIPNLHNFKKSYPRLSFHFTLSDSDKVIDKLKSGACDFAILESQFVTREMDFKILKAERFHLYGPASWKRRLLSDIIKTEPIIHNTSSQKDFTTTLLNKYKLHSFIKPEGHSSNEIHAVTDMVIGGLGYSALSEEAAEKFVKLGLLVKLHPTYSYSLKMALAWYKRAEKPEYFQALIKYIN